MLNICWSWGTLFSQSHLVQMDGMITTYKDKKHPLPFTLPSILSLTLLALIWPCVPREKNGKPLLMCAAYSLQNTHTLLHNMHYIVVEYPVVHIAWSHSTYAYPVVVSEGPVSCTWMYRYSILLFWRPFNFVWRSFFPRKHSLVLRNFYVSYSSHTSSFGISKGKAAGRQTKKIAPHIVTKASLKENPRQKQSITADTVLD